MPTRIVEEGVVVIDVNVWIDACLAVDEGTPAPSNWWDVPTSGRQAALGLFAGLSAPLRAEMIVVTDAELESIVMRKLTQPQTGPRPEDCGLDWLLERAQSAYETVKAPLHAVGRSWLVDPSPPAEYLDQADYEDRRIWGLFQTACREFPLADAFLISRDRAFVDQAAQASYLLESGRPSWLAGPPYDLTRMLGFYRT